MSKLTIEIDNEEDVAKVYINGVEIDAGSLIDSIHLSVIDAAAVSGSRVNCDIVFNNFFSGLHEGEHAEIAKSLRNSIRKLRELDRDSNFRIDSSLRFLLNTDRLFENIEKKED